MAARITQARARLNDSTWLSRSTPCTAIALCQVYGTITQIALVPFGVGEPGHPIPYFVGILAMSTATLTKPRGLDPVGRPSFWSIVRAGSPPAPSSEALYAFRRARAVVWVVAVYVAIAAVLAVAALVFGTVSPASPLGAWLVVGNGAAVCWWLRERRMRRREPRRAGQLAHQ